MKIGNCGALALALVIFTGACLADDKPGEPQKFYRLDFLVKEIEGGKVINSRAYSMQVATGREANEIRTGSKVPFASAPGQWVQIDVGTNIDCPYLKEEPSGELSLMLIAEVSSVLEDPSNAGHPTVRQNRWRSSVILKPKKPTVVFSSDDVASKHTMQFEVTATPVLQTP